jgi:hypothetical protein
MHFRLFIQIISNGKLILDFFGIFFMERIYLKTKNFTHLKIKLSNLRVALFLNQQSLRIRLQRDKKIIYATIAYISKS